MTERRLERLMPDAARGEIFITKERVGDARRGYSIWLGMSQGVLLLPYNVARGAWRVCRGFLWTWLNVILALIVASIALIVSAFGWIVVVPVWRLVYSIRLGFAGRLTTVLEPGDEMAADYGRFMDPTVDN